MLFEENAVTIATSLRKLPVEVAKGFNFFFFFKYGLYDKTTNCPLRVAVVRTRFPVCVQQICLFFSHFLVNLFNLL